MHSFKPTKVFYREIGKFFPQPWWEDAIALCLGGYNILPERPDKDIFISMFKTTRPFPVEIRQKWESQVPSQGRLLEVEDFFPKSWKRFMPEVPPEGSASEFQSVWDKGDLTRKGELMGTATSWPLLPLYTLYSFESTSLDRLVPITRKVTDLNQYKNRNIYVNRKPGVKVRTKELVRYVPKNWKDIDTTGDDAIMVMGPNHSARHTKCMEALGSVVSPTKDYFSPFYALYTEIIFHKGSRYGVIPLAPLAGPSGVGQVTWYSQPRSFIDASHRMGCNDRQILSSLKLSRFKGKWSGLAMQGAPLTFPGMLGGIDLPREFFGRRRRLSLRECKILTEISTLTIPELLLRFGVLPVDPKDKQTKDAKKSSLVETGTSSDKSVKDERFQILRGQEMALGSQFFVERAPEKGFEVTVTLQEYSDVKRLSAGMSQLEQKVDVKLDPSPLLYLSRYKIGKRTECDPDRTRRDVEKKLQKTETFPWSTLSKMAMTPIGYGNLEYIVPIKMVTVIPDNPILEPLAGDPE